MKRITAGRGEKFETCLMLSDLSIDQIGSNARGAPRFADLSPRVNRVRAPGMNNVNFTLAKSFALTDRNPSVGGARRWPTSREALVVPNGKPM